MTATKTKPAKAAESTKLPPGLAVRLPHHALETIDLRAVDVDPDNPRGKFTSEDVADLRSSIKAHGLLSPLIVADGWPNAERYLLLDGHRRRQALVDLGVEKADAYLLDPETAKALAGVIQLVANSQRVDIDPVLESDAIAKLLARPGFGVPEVAAQLARSEDYVRERVVLAGLSPYWREARSTTTTVPRASLSRRNADFVPSSWPMRWLREIALLPRDVQDELLKEWREHPYQAPNTFAGVIEDVRRRMRELGSAPWDLEAPDVVPGCVACAVCPKHSLATPGLFDDLVPADGLKKAVCRDEVCFSAKLEAATTARVEAAKAKNPDVPVVVLTRDGDVENKGKTIGGARVGRDWDFTKAKKGDRGAIAAVRDHGARASVEWVRPTRSFQDADPEGKAATTKKGKGAKPKAPAPLAERREALQDRRNFRAAQLAFELFDKFKGSPATLLEEDADLLAAVAAFGANVEAENLEPKDARARAGKWRPSLVSLVFEATTERLSAAIKWRKSGQPAEWARLALDLWPMGKTWVDLVFEASADIPEPKGWATEKGAPAKGKGKAAVAKPSARVTAAKNALKAAASPKSKATRKGRAKGQAAAANDDTADEEPTPGPAASRFYPLDAMVARERRDACPACGAPVVWHRVESGADVALDVTRQVEVLEAAGRSLLFERHAPHCNPRPRWTDSLRASTSRVAST